MRILATALAAATLGLAAPVWAHHGHGHGWHHRHHHGWSHHHRHHPDWRYHGYYAYRPYVRRDYVYYPPYPVYAAPAPVYPAPAPGVHIVVPNIYIPLR